MTSDSPVQGIGSGTTLVHDIDSGALVDRGERFGDCSGRGDRGRDRPAKRKRLPVIPESLSPFACHDYRETRSYSAGRLKNSRYGIQNPHRQNLGR